MKRFRLLRRWVPLAYGIIAAMIEYSFPHNHLRDGAQVVLTLSLVVFAVHVPMVIGLSVARSHEPPAERPQR